MPSTTSDPSGPALLLKERTATSSLPDAAVVHIRTAPVSKTVLPCGQSSPSTGSGKYWRAETGSAERGLSVLVLAEDEPCGGCTPARPSKTQCGSGALTIHLPASSSALVASAV